MPATEVKSARRVFEVLQMFRASSTPLTALQISQSLKYPLSSTSILLRFMADQGYLALDRLNRTYFPTAKVTELGDWIRGSSVLDPNLLSVAKLLHVECSETVCILGPEDGSMVVEHLLAAKHKIPLNIRPGDRLPMAHTISGMAYRRETAVDAPPQSPGERDLVWRHREVRCQLICHASTAHEYLIGESPLRRGFATMSFAVTDTVRDTLRILSIVGLTNRLIARERQIALAVIRRAAPLLAQRRYPSPRIHAPLESLAL